MYTFLLAYCMLNIEFNTKGFYLDLFYQQSLSQRKIDTIEHST